MSVASYQQRGASNNSSVNFNNTGSNNNNNSHNHNYNSADVNNGGSAAGSVRLAGDNTKDRMYEPKHNQKAVRVLTVIAYIFFVSLAAIMLSLYYVFIWNPPPPPQPSKLFTVITGGTIINITDCNNGIMTGQIFPTVVLETPKALPVINSNIKDRNEDTDANNFLISTTEMNSNQFYNNEINNNNNNDNASYPITMDDNYNDKTYNYTIDSSGINSDNGDSDNNYNNNDNYYI